MSQSLLLPTLAGVAAGLAVGLLFLFVHRRTQRRAADGVLATARREAEGLRVEARREAELAEAEAHGGKVAGPELKDARRRIIELEAENQALRHRIEAARERLKVLAARLSFLEQHGGGNAA